eukprot:6664547-Prymnesium_polylepis.2
MSTPAGSPSVLLLVSLFGRGIFRTTPGPLGACEAGSSGWPSVEGPLPGPARRTVRKLRAGSDPRATKCSPPRG